MKKRSFDLLASFCGLVLLSPLLFIIALAISLGSGAPVLFRQVRVGLKGRNFLVYKFRTMRPATGAQRGSFDAGSMARVTRLGSILRKWKLDELPQLWNVLKGDMALVGPRPEVRKWVDAYPERWAQVLTVRPGITDPASIVYRNEAEILAGAPDPEDYYRKEILPRKLDLYQRYVTTHTTRGDIMILFRTMMAVFNG